MVTFALGRTVYPQYTNVTEYRRRQTTDDRTETLLCHYAV